MSLPKKPRKCRHCKQMFNPVRCGQNTCCYECSVAVAEIVAERSKNRREKAERVAEVASRKIIRMKLEKLKTVSQLAKEVEQWINKIARLRDKDEPCISCDRQADWGGQWHASHFKSVGANSALRFNLLNIHKACSICNNHLSGNIAEYARRLPNRIGVERFRFIENHPRNRKYSREYLLRLKAVAMRWYKRLERRVKHEM